MERANDDQHGTASREKKRPAAHRMDNKLTFSIILFFLMFFLFVPVFRLPKIYSSAQHASAYGWKANAGSDTKAWQSNRRVLETPKLKSCGTTKRAYVVQVLEYKVWWSNWYSEYVLFHTGASPLKIPHHISHHITVVTVARSQDMREFFLKESSNWS